jgi:hypothetical protein
MALLNPWESDDLQSRREIVDSLRGKLDEFRDRVNKLFSRILPAIDVDILEVKGEVWEGLSRLYYNYEDDTQKRAFREVMCEMSEKICDGNWKAVYKRLYSIEQSSPA